jgi:Uma2 family endonuclease
MGGRGISMSTAPSRRVTAQEYLARERSADSRSEYLRGEIVAMSGASYNHALIEGNVIRQAGNQLADGPCRVLTSNMRVKVEASGLYTYPDIVIACADPQFDDNVFDTLLNPRVLIEVLSDSAERYDRGAKFGHYRQIPSLQEYVLISQDQPLVERYVRQADQSWLLTVFQGMTETFALTSIPLSVPLQDIYRGVKLS